jgi:hypothetical protein
MQGRRGSNSANNRTVGAGPNYILWEYLEFINNTDYKF